MKGGVYSRWLELDGLYGPFQLKPFSNSMIWLYDWNPMTYEEGRNISCPDSSLSNAVEWKCHYCALFGPAISCCFSPNLESACHLENGTAKFWSLLFRKACLLPETGRFLPEVWLLRQNKCIFSLGNAYTALEHRVWVIVQETELEAVMVSVSIYLTTYVGMCLSVHIKKALIKKKKLYIYTLYVCQHVSMLLNTCLGWYGSISLNVCFIPVSAMLLLKSVFSKQTAVLPLQCWSLIPLVHCLCNDKVWFLQKHLHSCFCCLIPSFCPPSPSAHLHISVRCLSLLSGELAISFTGLLHQVSTGLWALEALPAAALTEMNLVYLCNAQRVT